MHWTALFFRAMTVIVTELFLKTRHRAPMAAAAVLTLTTGVGIAGDLNAHKLSPRQVLVMRAEELQALNLGPGALRENLVVAGAPAEAIRPGNVLTFASGAAIGLTMFCEPCQRIAPLVGRLADMIERRGVLGVVLRGGTIARGDTLAVAVGGHRPLPDSMAQRFAEAVAAIPAGRVLRYSDVALAMGVDGSFVRALPGYIRRHLGTGLPVHRIVNARGQLLAALPGQAQQLAAEGIVTTDTVDLATCLWQP